MASTQVPHLLYPLNEGRGISPGDTYIEGPDRLNGNAWDAQRRPGHQPRRHGPAESSTRLPGAWQIVRSTKAGASAPATPSLRASLRSGRSLALNEGRGISPGDTSVCLGIGHRMSYGAALNEGRGISPGDTSVCGESRRELRRSTKAGASAPATPGASAGRACREALNEGRGMPRRHGMLLQVLALNEGRGISPGDTAKFCKRAVPRRNSSSSTDVGASMATSLRPFHAIANNTPSE